MGVGGCIRTALGVAGEPLRFDIPPGDLVTRLDQFADLTKVDIGFDAGLRGTTQGVHGWHDVEEALAILLRGTGQVCERSSDAPGISVHPVRDRQLGRRCLVLRSPDHVDLRSSPSEPPIDEVDILARPDLGTNFHDSPPIGSIPTKWDQRAIRDSGAQVVPDLLQSSPSIFPGGPSQDTHYASAEAAANSGLATGADIRGLSARSTLVMFNGHPVALSGSDASFVCLLQFPLDAITKLSTLSDGASGIYGTQAVGGVIDIDTLNHYSQDSRPESHFEVGGVTHGHQEKDRFSLKIGTHWQSGSVLAVAEGLQWDALPAYERGQANTARVPFTNPGNLVTSLETYPIPAGQSGQPLDFSTLTAGSPRLTDPQLGADILPSQKRWALYGSLDQALTERIQLWSYVLLTERNARESLGAQEVSLNVTHSPFLSDAPAGPIFEEYSLLKDFGPQIASVDVHTLNAALELHVQLPHEWRLVLSGSHSVETEAQVGTGQVDTTDLQASVSNPPANAFNPLGDGSNTTASVLASLDGPKWFASRSQVRSYEMIADGPLSSHGADGPQGAVGFEIRDQRFDWAISDPPAANDLRRLLYAGFSEIKVPLLDADTFPAPFRKLTLSLAGRVERYSDFGGSATPRIGATWAPFGFVEFRGTWARAVRAPDLGDLSQRNNSSFAQMLNGTSALVLSGGTPNLTVERALSRIVGMALHSDTAVTPQLRFDLDYFDIVSRNRIEEEPLTENILTDPLYAGLVYRNPDSSLQQYVCNNSTFVGGTRQSCLQQPFAAIIDLRLRNAGVLWTDGIDTRVGISVDSRTGTWALDLAGTYVLHYREATLPGAALVSSLDTESHPLALHLVGTASWKGAGFRTNLTVRYANGYHDTETQPVTRVGSWTTADLRVAYTFGREDGPRSHPTEVAVYAQNLFNRYPPFSNDVIARTGYDQENADLSGREVSLSVHVKW